MAKQIDVNVVAKADISDIEDLSSKIEEIKSNANVDVGVSVEDSEVESTQENIENLESDVEVDVNIDDTEIIGATESVDNLSNSIEDASSSSENLNNGLNVDSSALTDASNTADELAQSVDNADESTRALGGDLSLLEAGAMLDIANQLSMYGAAAEGLTQDMNTASITVGQLATQTGVAEPKMVSLINHISNATFPNDEAMMYVKSLDQIGVASENLGKSATDLDKINDAFGLGANTVNSLGQELSVLGVDMNNVSSSFNALAYANANTVGGMQNYYNFLRKYDAEFNELGFNVDQASVIIAAATQKFGGGRAALTGLNEALEESNGDTRALEQALGLQSGAISNATQLTGQYEGQLQTLADEEAEHKTLMDQLGAAWEDMSLSMSPILSPLGSFMGLIGQAGSYAVGINGLLKLAETFNILNVATLAETVSTKAAAAAQWLLNIAMDANPIMLVVIAIVALIAVLGYLYFNNEQVRAAIDGLGQTFIWVGQVMYTSIINAVNWIIGALQNLWNYVITLGGLLPANVDITGNQIIDTMLRVMLFISTLPLQLGMIFVNIIARTLGFGNNFSQRMISAASNGVRGFFSYISQLPGMLAGELQKMINNALNFAKNLPNILKQAALNAVNIWQWITGEHSPGKMYYMFKGELDEMESTADERKRTLPAIVGNMGSRIVEMFGDPTLGINYTDNVNTTGSTGDDSNRSVIINNYLTIGSVDSKDRIDEIIEELRKRLAFDNTTAGRTV